MIAQGVSKQTRFKRQTAKGTIATTAAGQVLRRQTSVFELQRESFSTADEITSVQQVVSVRLGPKAVKGTLNGLLSPGTYSDPLSALLRRDFTAVTTITGLALTVAGAGPTYTITRGAGSWITDGIKVGYVVRITAVANASNLNKNLFVVSLTATVLTVIVVNGSALVAEGPTAASAVSVPGKVTWAPGTGHTQIYFTFEEWFPDVPYSERFQDCRVGSAQLTLPGQGNATIQMAIDGLDYTTGTAAYYTAPTSETTSETCNASSGVMLVNGTAVATITDLQFTIDGNQSLADPVVGNNVRPDVFVGKVGASGQFTAYFDSSTNQDNFAGEVDVALAGVLPNGSLAAADFIAWALPKLNITAASPADGETGLKRTYRFMAEYNAAGGAGATTNQTTLQIQDSLA